MTEYYIYKTRPNDRWDSIAVKFRGDTFDYSDIIEANPHVPIKPVLDEGIEIRIPIKEETSEDKSKLPIWKQD